MRIVVDKNQLASGAHEESNRKKHETMLSHGVELIPLPLPFGDYILHTEAVEKAISGKKHPTKKDLVGAYTIAVDTKKNLGEVATNLFSQDKSRFYDEIRGAYQNGVKIIFLVEHGGSVKELKDVAKYKIKYMRWTGKDLMEKIYLTERAYGCKFVFCDKRVTGKKIIEILGENYEKT